jgi:hypothetical protein
MSTSNGPKYTVWFRANRALYPLTPRTKNFVLTAVHDLEQHGLMIQSLTDENNCPINLDQMED